MFSMVARSPPHIQHFPEPQLFLFILFPQLLHLRGFFRIRMSLSGNSTSPNSVTYPQLQP